MDRKQIEKLAHNWEFQYVDKLDEATEFAIEISNATIDEAIKILKHAPIEMEEKEWLINAIESLKIAN